MLRLGRRVNIWIRQNETDKRTFYSACMCYGLLGFFAWTKKFVFFFDNGRKLCFASDSDTTTDIDICGHVTMWQWMEFVCDSVIFLEAWIVASSRYMEFDVVKCWRCEYVIHASLTSDILRFLHTQAYHAIYANESIWELWDLKQTRTLNERNSAVQETFVNFLLICNFD